MESELVRLCLNAACESRESIEKWRKQRRSLEQLPSHLADALIRRLLRRRLLYPSLLEVFKHSVENIELKDYKLVDAEWMAYIGSFRCLNSLNLSDCNRINNSAVWPLSGMTNLKELDLSRCSRVTDAGIKHLLSISTLEKLWIPQTGLTADGVALLSSLRNLSLLDLGGLPVTDATLASLKGLTKLQYLDLWGSRVSDKGVIILQMLPKLSFLSLAWTNVSSMPDMPSLESLNLSNCNIKSVLERNDDDKAHLVKLALSGATFANGTESFFYTKSTTLSFLDMSNSSISRFDFLAQMISLKHLDLSSCMIGDDAVGLIANIGVTLKDLNLSKTRLTSAGVAVLASSVPDLEILSLSHTEIDDAAISFISMMPSLKAIDLSHTNIRGFTYQVGAEQDLAFSLTALQSLHSLERLNLEETQIRDDALHPLSSFQNLRLLFLRSASLTDITLYRLSSLSKLTSLAICNAVLTNCALASFIPPATLEFLDLRGCWLLTEDAISSFCRSNPRLEVRHELVQAISSFCRSNQSLSNNPSPSRISSRVTPPDKRQGKMPVSYSFQDQRFKYSREELLSLQYSTQTFVRPKTQ